MPTELEFGLRLPGTARVGDAQKGLERLAFSLGRSVDSVAPVLAREIQRFLDEVRRALLRRHSKAFVNPVHVPATGEEDLLRRRGGISNIRIAVSAARDINSVAGRLIVPFPISVHEEGATIRPRTAQYLTIPLAAALDARGVPVRPRARDWPDTFVRKSRRGNLLIFQRRGAEIVPLYLLRRQVRLPPRLGAQDTIDAGSEFFVDQAIAAMADAIMDGIKA